MKRVLKYILLIYVGINIIVGYLFWPRIDQFLRFMPRISPPEYSAAQSTAEAQQQDISYLENILLYDRSFSDAAQTKFRDRAQDIKSQTDEMTKAEFYLAVRELTSIADNGHTSVGASPVFQDFNRSGVDIYSFKDGYFIVRAHKDHADLVGKQATHIDGRPIADIIKDLRIYTGGPDNWRDIRALNILRSPALLHAAGLIDNPDEITLTVQSEGNETHQVEISALPAAGDTGYYRHPFMMLVPDTLNDEGDDWARTLNGAPETVASYLEKTSDIVKSEPVGNGLYIRSNYLLGSKDYSVKKALLSSLEQAPDSGYDFIVVDLRWNPGGDYGNAVPFARELKNVLNEDGTIYVITGAHTFSAAIVTSALIKQSAPDQTLIIGETMGDRPQFWAERGKPFILPNSGYWINYATGFHDWEKGCTKTHKYCFPPNKKHEKDIGTLSLDVEIAPTYSEYAAGHDVVMDWVLKQEK